MDFKAKNLLILCGPTGVGKSAIAVQIAKAFNGEVISCDSMQVYRGFDVGTDKIPPHKREGIVHYLLDSVDPSIQFTAADFVSQTLKALQSIRRKRKFPIITGGTGLYLKALIDGLFPGGEKDPRVRQKLEVEAQKKGLEHLQKRLERIDPVFAKKIGPNDKARIIRALEVYTSTQIPISEHFINTRSPIKDFHVIRIGLELEKKELYQRIETRVDRMFEQGIVEEVQRLLDSGVDEMSPPFRALGYKHVLNYLKKQHSLEDTIRLTKQDTRHYAKRQMTWFRKMPGIRWFSPHDFSSISDFISNSLV